jgi:D-cysteine desulfhydrase
MTTPVRHPQDAGTGWGAIPRVDLGVRPTPLERRTVDGVGLLIKRDDLSAGALGGNKVRALERLLAGAGPGTRLLTVGATGSTHALAVATYGARLGASVEVVTWPQEAHDVARATAVAMHRQAAVTPAWSVADAYLRAAWRRFDRDVRWIPAGASVPLGALGHVDAALELANQLAADGIDPPEALVVPLGSGGTAAGLLAGLALAGLPTRVIGVQVVPRIVATHGRVLGLARRTLALLARECGTRAPALEPRRFAIERRGYGGAYGRETTGARAASELLRAAGGPRLDPTYSAKAFAEALALARRSPDGSILFWLTFDARWLP